jgi:hypothetical protein
MTKVQKIITAGVAVALIGVFVVSDFKWIKTNKKSKTGDANASGEPMDNNELAAEKSFSKATGDCGCLSVNDLSLKK